MESATLSESTIWTLTEILRDNADAPITTLTITDFGVRLVNPSDVTKYLKAEDAAATVTTIVPVLTHIGQVPFTMMDAFDGVL